MAKIIESITGPKTYYMNYYFHRSELIKKGVDCVNRLLFDANQKGLDGHKLVKITRHDPLLSAQSDGYEVEYKVFYEKGQKG